MITISIVSHGHGEMVSRLLRQLLTCPEVSQIIVTWNIPEPIPSFKGGIIQYIENIVPKGFGANHNAAFMQCNQNYFCPLNPDVQLVTNPFPELLRSMVQKNASVVAPLVKSSSDITEDSIRRFPTLVSLFFKAVGGQDGRYFITPTSAGLFPEWVAGMFMLFRSEDFRRLQGFDEKFFLYYEDVDICARAWKSGMKVLACPSVSVIHDAQRASRRNLQHMKWHAASMMRYFWKHAGRLPPVS